MRDAGSGKRIVDVMDGMDVMDVMDREDEKDPVQHRLTRDPQLLTSHVSHAVTSVTSLQLSCRSPQVGLSTISSTVVLDG